MQIHNKMAFRRLHRRYSNLYVDFFIELRRFGYKKSEAADAAKIKLQDIVITEMLEKKQTKLIFQVYQALKDDHDFFDRAQQHFDLNE